MARRQAPNANTASTPAQWIYDLEVIAGTKVLNVKVDATTAAILSSAQDSVDNGSS